MTDLNDKYKTKAENIESKLEALTTTAPIRPNYDFGVSPTADESVKESFNTSVVAPDLGKAAPFQPDYVAPFSTKLDYVGTTAAHTAGELVKGVGEIAGLAPNLAKQFGGEDVLDIGEDDNFLKVIGKKLGSWNESLSEGIVGVGSGIQTFNEDLGGTVALELQASKLQRRFKEADLGMRTLSSAYLSSIGDLKDPSLIFDFALATLPSLAAVVGMGKYKTMALAAAGRSVDAPENMVTKSSYDFLGKALQSGEMYDEDATFIANTLEFVTKPEDVAVLVGMVRDMLKSAGSDIKFDPPSDTEVAVSRALAATSAVVDYGALGKLAEMNKLVKTAKGSLGKTFTPKANKVSGGKSRNDAGDATFDNTPEQLALTGSGTPTLGGASRGALPAPEPKVRLDVKLGESKVGPDGLKDPLTAKVGTKSDGLNTAAPKVGKPDQPVVPHKAPSDVGPAKTPTSKDVALRPTESPSPAAVGEKLGIHDYLPAFLRIPASAALEGVAEGSVEVLEQMSENRGSLRERYEGVDHSQVAGAAVGGIGAGGAISVGASPLTWRAAAGAAKKGKSAAVKVSAPIVTKMSNLLRPTEETLAAAEAMNTVPKGAVNTSEFTFKDKPVPEDYNPIAAAHGVFDRAAEFASAMGDDRAEAASLLNATYQEAREHIRNAVLYEEQAAKSADVTAETKKAITEAVQQLTDNYLFVTQQMGKDATEALLDNDLAMNAKQTKDASDTVMRSLDYGTQTLADLKALADSQVFKNNEEAQSRIKDAISIKEAETKLRNAVSMEEVSNHYLDGNPDKEGHYGIREYLARANLARELNDERALAEVARRLKSWLTSGENTEIKANTEKANKARELRELERNYISVALARVLKMMGEKATNTSEGAKPEEVSGKGKSTKRTVSPKVGDSYSKALKLANAAKETVKDKRGKAAAFLSSIARSIDTHTEDSDVKARLQGLLKAAEAKYSKAFPDVAAAAETTTETTSESVEEVDTFFEDNQAYLNSQTEEQDTTTDTDANPEVDTEDPTSVTTESGTSEAVSETPIEVTGNVVNVISGSNEKAPSKLILGKSLNQLISKPDVTTNRSKGIFQFVVDGKRILTNSKLLTDKASFVKTVGAAIKARFPKITETQLKEANRQANKLFAILRDSANKGLLAKEGDTGAVYTGMESPLNLLLVQDSDGKLRLPATVRATIQISALDWANSLGRENVWRDEGSVKSLFGLGEYDVLPDHIMDGYANIGTKRAVVANGIGKNIRKALGVKFASEKVPTGFSNNFDTALGLAAIGYLTDIGVIVNNTVSANKWAQDYSEATGKSLDAAGDLQAITFVQLATENHKPSSAVENAVEPFHKVASLGDMLLRNDTAGAQVTTEPDDSVNPVTNKGTTIDKRLVNALKKYQQTPYMSNRNMLPILSQPNAKEILEKLMGITDFNPIDFHISRRAAKVSANQNMQREVERLLDAYEKNPDLLTNPMYIRSGFSFQLRNMMLTRDINPQNYKSHRDFVSTESSNINVDMDVLNDATKVSSLYDALLTALGADETTKQSQRLASIEAIKTVGTAISAPLAKSLRNYVDGNVVTSEGIQTIIDEFYAIPEMVSALGALGKKTPTGLSALNTALNIFLMHEVLEGRQFNFTGQFEVEIDGKTNGFFLLGAQIPVLKNMNTWFERTGLYVEGATDSASFNQFINRADSLDSYEATGSIAVTSLRDKALKDFLEFIFGELVTPEGKVTSALRNIMKNPFMIFNYGASLGRVTKDAKLALAAGIVEKAEDIFANAKAANKLEGSERDDALKAAKAELDTFNKLLGTSFNTTTLMQDAVSMEAAIQRHVFNQKYGKGDGAVSTMGTLFGNMISKAIGESMGEMVTVRDAVNATFLHQWKMYDDALTAGLARLEAKGEVSQAEADELTNKLKPLLPHYHGYTDSKGASSVSRIPVFNTEVVVTENSSVQVRFKGGVLGDQNSLSAQALRTKITDGGVSGFSIAVHSQDAVIMLRLYEELGQLQGRHDAEAVGAFDRINSSSAANKITAEVISKYSMLHDFISSAQDSFNFAVDRGAEVNSETLVALGQSLVELKALVEDVDQLRVKQLDGKNVVVDQYPTLVGEGAYATKLELKPNRVKGFQKILNGFTDALNKMYLSPPPDLVELLNEYVVKADSNVIRLMDEYAESHLDEGFSDLNPAEKLILILGKMATDSVFAKNLILNNPELHRGIVNAHNNASSYAETLRTEAGELQTRNSAKINSAIMRALTPTTASPLVTSKMLEVLEREEHAWLGRSFANFIARNKGLVDNPKLLDKTLKPTVRLVEFMQHIAELGGAEGIVDGGESSPLIDAYFKSKARKSAYELAMEAAKENVEDTEEDSITPRTMGSLDVETDGERVDPVKLAEDAEVQPVNASTIKTLYEAFRDVSENLSPEIRDVYDGLISKLISPAMETIGEIGLQIKENVEGIKGNFGALTTDGISIVSGLTRTLNVQSTAEIFLHELVHRISVEALSLDPVARGHLTTLFDQARAGLDYTVFLNKDSDGNTVFLTSEAAEIAHAKAMFDYVFNNASQMKMEDGSVVAVGLLEFVSYALTNPAMMMALKGIKANKTPRSGFKFINRFSDDSLIAKIFNWMYSAISTAVDFIVDSPKGTDLHQRVFDLVMDLNGLQQKHTLSSRRLLARRAGKIATGVNERVSGYVNGVLKALQHNRVTTPAITMLRQVLRIKLVEAGARLKGMSVEEIDKMIDAVKDANDPIAAMNGLYSKHSLFKEEGLVTSIRDTLTGKLSRTAPNISRVLNRALSLTDRQREAVRSGIKNSVVDGFSQRLSGLEAEVLTPSLITTDIVTLVDRFGATMVGKFLRDRQAIHEKAAQLEKAIRANNPQYAEGLIAQAKGMGRVIITGKGAVENQTSNIGALVDGSPWSTFIHNFGATHNDAEQMHRDLDAYVSLQAMLNVEKSALALASKVWDREFTYNKNVNGITNILQLHRGMKEESITHLFNGDPKHAVKGYTPQMYDQNMEWQTANPIRAKELERLGWKKVYDIKTAVEGGSLALYARKSNGGTGFQKGAFGYDGERSRGTSLVEAYTEAMGAYSKLTIDDVQDRAKKAYSRRAMQQMVKGYRGTGRTNPIATIDADGNIVGYAHLMSEEVKRSVLGKTTNIAEVMGDYGAVTTSKRGTSMVNSEVLTALKEDFDKHFAKDPSQYVWVTSEEWASDGSRNPYFNQYRMLSYDTRKEAREMFGNRGIPVRKGLGRVVFGGRKYSIANSNMVTMLSERFPNIPMGGIREIVANLEMVWQEIVRVAKVGIVIKTPMVVMINIVSNMMVLAVNRIDPITASRDAVIGIRELRRYEALNKQHVVLQAKLRGATSQVEARRIAIELTRIRSNMDASPIRPLLEEGMFQSIVEDVDVSKFGYFDKMTDYVKRRGENYFGTKVVDAVTWLPNQMFMGSSSGLFKGMNKLTQYSDFIARYSYVKQISARKDAPPIAEIYNSAIDSFINYNIPDQQGLQYANDMGLVMFTKYFLGIQHVIVKLFKEKPTEALIAALGNIFLYDISDIYDDSMVNKGITKPFKSPLDVLEAATTMYGVEFWKNFIPTK